MSHQLENAKNLYLRGIRDGEIKEVHENYMGV
ncbi:polyketide cyclase, partial [Streptococcus suis]